VAVAKVMAMMSKVVTTTLEVYVVAARMWPALYLPRLLM
jgi:hypothetical protein